MRNRKMRNRKMTLSDLRVRFLRNSLLEEQAFLFVFEIFHLKKLLAESNLGLAHNDFVSLLHAETIFELCIILDNVIRKKNPAKGQYIDHLAFLSSMMSLNLTKDRLGKINGCFKNDFPKKLTDLLRSQYTSPDGANIQGIEEDLVITYGLRNFGAHEIQNQPEISNNLEAIVQRCMNSIFFTITSLY
jgi:hypothetical protein